MKLGSALAFTLILLSMFSVAFLAVLGLALNQIEIVFSASRSLNAFYAADSATEQALYNIFVDNNFNPFNGSLLNGAQFSVAPPYPKIEATQIVIKAVGVFQETQRAIETTMQTQ